MEKSTGELLEILKSKKNYDEFLKEEIGELLFESLSDYLDTLVKNKGLKKSEIIERANLDRNYAYQIFNGYKKNPSRDKILMLAFGMKLNLAETEKLLKMAKLPALYVRDPRDNAIIFCINKGMTLIEANENLLDHHIAILE